MPKTSALLVLKPQMRSMGSAMEVQSNPWTSYISSTTLTSHGSYMGDVLSWYAAKFGVNISTSAGVLCKMLGGGGSASGVRLNLLSECCEGDGAVGISGEPVWKSPNPDSSPLSDIGEL